MGFSQAASSSTAKGETVADTIRMVSAYSDIIVMRHPKEGAPVVASNVSDVPVINAGDGGQFHPTQTLTDLLTIKKKKGGFENLTVGVCGDLKYGRTVHSLIAALSRYTGIRVVLIAPDELRLPGYVKYGVMDKSGISYTETSDLEAVMPELDVLYMTRIQRERLSDLDTYERLKDSYILTPEKLAGAKSDMSILHPLPRVNEISVAIDQDPRACYFKQVLNGKYMRMALILKLLEEAKTAPAREESEVERTAIPVPGMVCRSTRCITTTEQELPRLFHLVDKEKGIYRCLYCEKKAKRE